MHATVCKTGKEEELTWSLQAKDNGNQGVRLLAKKKLSPMLLLVLCYPLFSFTFMSVFIPFVCLMVPSPLFILVPFLWFFYMFSFASPILTKKRSLLQLWLLHAHGA
jgi:hypothetical protein